MMRIVRWYAFLGQCGFSDFLPEWGCPKPLARRKNKLPSSWKCSSIYCSPLICYSWAQSNRHGQWFYCWDMKVDVWNLHILWSVAWGNKFGNMRNGDGATGSLNYQQATRRLKTQYNISVCGVNVHVLTWNTLWLRREIFQSGHNAHAIQSWWYGWQETSILWWGLKVELYSQSSMWFIT